MGGKEAILGGARAFALVGALAVAATGCKHDAAPSAAGVPLPYAYAFVRAHAPL